MSRYQDILVEHINVFATLQDLEAAVETAASRITESMVAGCKLMICGNGGSAADSQHLAAEFTGRFIKDRRALAAMALSTDSSALTCIANDYSFEDVFARQIQGLARQGDCLLAISTSGNSLNVIKAVKVARSLGVLTIALVGRKGGQLKEICDLAIVVPSDTTARIQEAHIFIGHAICGSVEQNLGLVDRS